MTVHVVSTHVAQDAKTVYIKRVKETHLMQLTAKSMQVEFRPHNILTDKFVYSLKLKGDVMSQRLMNKREMTETVRARLDIGYQVTDFLTEPQEYFPACC